jgi:hypothetical protein
VVNLDIDRARRISMFSLARKATLWLAAAAVKTQDELAALGLDGGFASHKLPDYPGNGKHQIWTYSTTKCLDIDRPSHGRPNHSLTRLRDVYRPL